MISAASGPTKWTPKKKKTLPVFEWEIILANALALLRYDKLLIIGLQRTLKALIQLSHKPQVSEWLHHHRDMLQLMFWILSQENANLKLFSILKKMKIG